MTDELLPPDPSKDGFYWLAHSSGRPRVWEWCVDGAEGSWQRDSAVGSAREMATWGYLLASPHPIPEPAELDALHQAISDILDEMTLAANPGLASKASGWLRAALGIKP